MRSRIVNINGIDMEEFEGEYFPVGTVHEDEFYYYDEMNFVWDKRKNEVNIQTHGVDFQTAALVFNDPDALTVYDKEHSEESGETRYNEIGRPIDVHNTLDIPGFEDIPRAFLGEAEDVLLVVYTIREFDRKEYYRIISARPADEDETREYEKKKKHRKNKRK